MRVAGKMIEQVLLRVKGQILQELWDMKYASPGSFSENSYNRAIDDVIKKLEDGMRNWRDWMKKLSSKDRGTNTL